MEPDPDPSKAVTAAVKDKVAQTGLAMTPQRRAQLLAMFAAPPPAGPVQVTVAQIAAALGGGRTRIANTRFELAVSGGTINLYKRGTDERIGHITGPLDGAVALVETVKVEDAFQGQGLGKLLAVAYYEWAASEGATDVALGTDDTSGGFWARQGMAKNRRATIAVARGQAGNQAFNIG